MKIQEIHQPLHRGDRPETRKTRIGILLARRQGSNIVLGWSRCNTAAGDKFNHEEGLAAAIRNLGKPLPISFARRRKDIARFRARAARYFKESPIPVWG